MCFVVRRCTLPNPLVSNQTQVLWGIRMKSVCYLLSGLISTAVIVLTLCMVNSPFSLTAVYFCLWGILPWVYVVFLTSINRSINFLRAIAALTLVVGGAGIAGIIDALYFHPDAQGGLVFVFFPLYQTVILLVMTPLIYFFTRGKQPSA